VFSKINAYSFASHSCTVMILKGRQGLASLRAQRLLGRLAYNLHTCDLRDVSTQIVNCLIHQWSGTANGMNMPPNQHETRLNCMNSSWDQLQTGKQSWSQSLNLTFFQVSRVICGPNLKKQERMKEKLQEIREYTAKDYFFSG
jgi:hypothetical protein